MSFEKLKNAVGEINAHVEQAQEKHVPVNTDFLVGKLVEATNHLFEIELDKVTEPEPVKAEGEADSSAGA